MAGASVFAVILSDCTVSPFSATSAVPSTSPGSTGAGTFSGKISFIPIYAPPEAVKTPRGASHASETALTMPPVTGSSGSSGSSGVVSFQFAKP